jgi:hypothetical protein
MQDLRMEWTALKRFGWMVFCRALVSSVEVVRKQRSLPCIYLFHIVLTWKVRKRDRLLSEVV